MDETDFGHGTESCYTFGRKLAEVITAEMLDSLGLRHHRELLNTIDQLSRAKGVADWIPSYLHSLRIFGNEGVHALAGPDERVSSVLQPEILVRILSAVRAIVGFWRLWCGRSTWA